MLVVFILAFMAFCLYQIYKPRKNRFNQEGVVVIFEPPPAITEEQPVQAHDQKLFKAEEIEPDKMIVRDLSNRTATLIIRQRKIRNSCVGQLIIWAGKKRSKRAGNDGDSIYSLGEASGSTVSNEVINDFIAKAIQMITEIRNEGIEKRKTTVPADFHLGEVSSTILMPDVDPAILIASVASPLETPVLDETPAPVKTRHKFPSIYRGKILNMGYSNRSKNGREFRSYSVKIVGDDGIVEEVFGAHLKTACREANVAIGDTCEIHKIGKRTSDEMGKAPMSLFQVSKLDHSSSVDNGILNSDKAA